MQLTSGVHPISAFMVLQISHRSTSISLRLFFEVATGSKLHLSGLWLRSVLHCFDHLSVLAGDVKNFSNLDL